MRKILFGVLLAAGVAACGDKVSNTYDEPIEQELYRPKHSCCCTKKLLGCMGNCGCPCESCYNAVKRGD